MLVTQVSDRAGLVTPVREIVAMARARGVDTVVDAAHGVAMLDFHMDDLGADFVAWSAHEWTSAPLGTGAMFIRRKRLADIGPAYGNDLLDDGDINTRVPEGTINFAALLTIPIAVDCSFAVGPAAKESTCAGCGTAGSLACATYRASRWRCRTLLPLLHHPPAFAGRA